MITYLIEVSICWLLFYSIYILLLRKETFFNINRWYLLSTLVLGLLIPLFTVDFSSLFYQEPTSSVVYLAEGFSELEYVIEASVEEAKSTNYSWLTLAMLLYGFGVIAAFCRFLYGFRQIYGLYQEGEIIKKGNYNLVLTKTQHLPFSFFNYLFWNEATTLEDKDSGKIITHELAHINQWHSLDVLFLEFLGIALWFSPPIYWYKKSLRTVHEYLADAYVLRDTKKKQYGHLLIRQVQSGMQVALANNFIHSQLKQRINMMTRNKSRRKALTRYLPALPLLLLMVLVFSNKNVQKNFNETTAKASLAFDELSPDVLKALVTIEDVHFFDGDFDPIKVKQQLTDAYILIDRYNFIGRVPSEQEIKKMEDSKKIKNLHQAAKRFISNYPDHEIEIRALTKEIALENGYTLRFNGENIIYRFTNKEKQVEEAELFKLLVVNGAIVGATDGIIPSNEIQKLEELSPEQAMARFGEDNGANGAVLIDSDSWTVLESNQGETILVRKDGADTYDDGNHTVKKIANLEDTPPVFPGGEKEMLRFIYRNIKYPVEARNKGIYGTAIVRFTVGIDGMITNPKITKNVAGGISEEVLRVTKLMQALPQKWTSGKIDGKAVAMTFELPVDYRLEGDDFDGTLFEKQVDGNRKPIAIVTGLSAAKLEDTAPLFPGGENEMLKFIYTNIKYPAEARRKGIYGNLMAQFVIGKDGSLSNIEISNDLGGGIEEEILRVLRLMQTIPTKWTPARTDGRAIRSTYKLPFKYRLEGQNEDGTWFTKEASTNEFGSKVVVIGLYKTTKKEVLKKTDPVYKEVDEMPHFPGCENNEGTKEEINQCAQREMLQFIYSNIKYPAAARKGGIEGTVVVRFVVDKTGMITAKEIVRSIGGGTDMEVLSTVGKMPKWIPGKKDGKNVSVYFNLPVKFKLEKDTKPSNLTPSKAPTETADGEPIFKVVEQMPRFPGCEEEEGDNDALKKCADQKMLDYIYKHVKYPTAARKTGTEGVAVVRFLVGKDGSINDAEILRNPGEGTGEEALRVVNLMTEQDIKWTSGRQKGEAVNVQFILPIKFKLSKEAKEVLANATAETDNSNEKPKKLLKRGLPAENVTLQLGKNTLTLNAFPNPAREKLTITLEGKAKDILVTVFDVTGKEYFRDKVQAFDGTYYQTIDLDDAPTGTLIVNVRHKGKDYQKKVIVQ